MNTQGFALVESIFFGFGLVLLVAMIIVAIWLLGDTLIDHGGDTFGDEIRLVWSEMLAPMAVIWTMGAGLGLISRW